MNQKGLSQEGLKLIACITMLLDHIGAVIIFWLYMQAWRAQDYTVSNSWLQLYRLLRIIGRIAFPIFCFLLVEGVHYTRSPKKYLLRLAIGAVISEIPFDLAISNGITWESCSVMVTLLLGCMMILAMQRMKGVWKIAVIPPFFLLAELLGTDYAGKGIAIIAMLALTKDAPREKLLRTLGFVILLRFGAPVKIGPVSVPMELFALIGLIPMFCYQGRKLTRNKAVQWTFYLFYPVHLLVLWVLKKILIG